MCYTVRINDPTNIRTVPIISLALNASFSTITQIKRVSGKFKRYIAETGITEPCLSAYAKKRYDSVFVKSPIMIISVLLVDS